MKNKSIAKTLAAVTAFALVGGALPTGNTSLFGSPSIVKADTITPDNYDHGNDPDHLDNFDPAVFDEETGVLTLKGNVNRVDVRKYVYDEKRDEVKKVVCEEGTVFPADCSNLFSRFKAETFDLSNADTSNVTDMRDMFYGCSSIESLDLSSFDTSNVTDMSYMFDGCSSIESLDLSSFDTSNVTDMHGMFLNCSSLTSLDLSNFNTSKVNNMQIMFSDCSSLESLDVSSFDTSCVSNMNWMFQSCSKLKLSNFDVSGFYVSKGFGMFHDCYALYPDIVKISSTSATVDGGIDINFHIIEKGYIESSVSANLAKIVISGPNGDRVFTNFSQQIGENHDGIDDGVEISNGRMIFPYYLTAAQANDKVTIKAYDKDDNQLILCNSNLVYSLCSYSQFETSLNNYLNDLKNYNPYKKDENLQHFVSCLEEYCNSAENYFKGTKNKIHFIYDRNSYELDYYKPTFGDDIKISLVLNSEPAVRIYTKGKEIKIDGKTVTPKTSKYGTYYEITNIPVRKLKLNHTLTVDGVEYKFSPLSYCYRICNKSDVMNEYEDLKTVAWGFYEYALAANNLREGQYLYIEE